MTCHRLVSYYLHMAHEDIAERTAQAVSQAIITSRFSIKDVSEKSGIPYTTLTRRLQGFDPTFTATEIYRISKALEVRPASLLPREFTAIEVAS